MNQGQDKYRFYICTDGSHNVPVMLAKAVTFSGEKVQDLWDHRKKSSEWKITRSQNRKVYDAMALAIASPSTQVDKITVKAELYDTWTTLTSVEYEGYIPIGSIKANLDVGYIMFTPEDDGKYQWWDGHKTDKIDLIETCANTNTITIDETSWSQDYWIPLSGDCSDPFLINLALIDANPPTYNIQAWAVEQNYYEDGPTTGWWRKEGWVRYAPYNDYYYYYCIKSHHSSINNAPGTPGGVNYWRIYDWDPYLNVVYHVRQQQSFFYLPGFVRGNGVYQPCFYGQVDDNRAATNCPGDRYCKAAINPVTEAAIVSTQGNIQLFAAINNLLTGSGLTFHSHFFSDAVSPVTGLANKLANPYLSHKSHIVDINYHTKAYIGEVKGEVTIESLINDLCETFNCLWYIDSDNNYLVVEHVKFYENGKQYVGTPDLYTDLTDKALYKLKDQTIEDITGIATDGEFNFGNKSPQKETFKMIDTEDVESIILYTSAFVKDGEIIAHAPEIISTDLLWVTRWIDKSNKEGYCLLATDANKKVYRRTFECRTMNNPLFTNYPNGDLMYDNLIRDFWMHGRYFSVGRINDGINTETDSVFTTQGKTKVQREIKFPRLQPGAFDPTKLIKTNLGLGEVKSYEYKTDGDFIKVTLLYAMN